MANIEPCDIILRYADLIPFAIPMVFPAAAAVGCNVLENSERIVCRAIGWAGTRVFTLTTALAGLVLIVWAGVRAIFANLLNALTAGQFEKVRHLAQIANSQLNQMAAGIAIVCTSLLIVDFREIFSAIANNNPQVLVNTISNVGSKLGVPQVYITAGQNFAQSGSVASLLPIVTHLMGGAALGASEPLAAQTNTPGGASLGNAAAAVGNQQNNTPASANNPLLNSNAAPPNLAALANASQLMQQFAGISPEALQSFLSANAAPMAHGSNANHPHTVPPASFSNHVDPAVAAELAAQGLDIHGLFLGLPITF